MKNIVILISGRGSNMEALIAARDAGNLPVNIAAVISNRPDAQGLETAARPVSSPITSTTRALPGAPPSMRRWPSALIVSSLIWSCWPVSCAS
jgi:hypothetical protein